MWWRGLLGDRGMRSLGGVGFSCREDEEEGGEGQDQGASFRSTFFVFSVRRLMTLVGRRRLQAQLKQQGDQEVPSRLLLDTTEPTYFSNPTAALIKDLRRRLPPVSFRCASFLQTVGALADNFSQLPRSWFD